MKQTKKNIDREGAGSVTLIPEEPEDMWHLYNLIRPKDKLRGSAFRKVSKETGAGGETRGGARTKTVRTTLSITVISVDFDPSADQLHVPGRVCEENEWVPLGSHHTLDLDLHRQFTLEKPAGGWDSVALDALKQATDERHKAEIWAVVMQEGLANICVITEYQTKLRHRVSVDIPRKRIGYGSDAHDKGLQKFFELVLTTLLRHMDVKDGAATSKVDKDTPPLLLASPAWTASSFQKYIIEYATHLNDKPLMQYAKNSVIVAHSATGHLHALSDALKSKQVMTQLKDTKYARESNLLDKFMKLLRDDEGFAWYGPNEVTKAVEEGAVGRGGGVLLISDELFRAKKVEIRRRWVALVDAVKEQGGEVRVVSSSHGSGKKLQGLGGIAAILTYPLFDLDEGEEEAEAEAEEGLNGEQSEDEDEPHRPEDDIEI